MGNSKAKGILVPPFPKEILSIIATVDDLVLLSVNENIEFLNKLMGSIPQPYRWRFRTVDAFKAEATQLIETGANPTEINKLYWEDTLNNCEAYSVMSICRLIELARSAVWAVARKDIVCAALIARAALENTVQYVDAARTITATIMKSILDQSFIEDNAPNDELEDYLLKTVFASRLPDVEDYYKPTNIMTIIDRIAKSPGQSVVKDHYNFLCEIAHPNFVGRSVYILDTKIGSRAGDEIRTLGIGSGNNSVDILISTVWAVSWAVGTQCSATQLMQSSIGSVKSALEKF